MTWRSLLETYWLSPGRYRDFAWAWWCRLLVTMGMVSIMLYLLYFIIDQLGVPLANASAVQTKALGLYFLGSVFAAIVFGWISDKIQRRKPVALISCAMTSLGICTVLVLPGMSSFFVAMTLMGIGQGAFLAVDVALMTEVLPSSQDAGKDLGVVALSFQLPQVLVPLTAVPILGLAGGAGCSFLYAWSAVLILAGGLAVTRVRAVR